MRLIVLSIVFIGISFLSLSQQKKLRAYLDEKQYYVTQTGNYIEIQLQYVGHTLNYVSTPSGLQGELAVIMKFLKNDSIITSDAFRLQTPIVKDSIFEDFYDIRRFALQPGKYTFTIELKDLNSSNESLSATKEIEIINYANQTKISEIEIAESIKKGDESSVLFKSGYNITPKISNYFPNELNFMPVYFEIYNTNLLGQDAFGVKQKLINTETNEELTNYTKSTKHSVSEIVPIIRNIDIETLLSGKYILQYSIFNKEMVEIDVRNYEFERSNDLEMDYNPDKIILNPSFQESIPKDSVLFFVASLIPMSKPAEVKNILTLIRTKNEENGRKYIQGYWLKTAGTKAYEEWIRYKAQVMMVQKLYKNSFQAGFETDRGRVYLQYGPPSSIQQRETSATDYPYEIWQYNKIGSFSNKRFIFYNPDLVSNSYKLLHSDMIGETKNLNWQQVLSGRTNPNGTNQSTDPYQNQNNQQSIGNGNY